MRPEAGTFKNEYTADPPTWEKQSEGKSKSVKVKRKLKSIAQSKERFT